MLSRHVLLIVALATVVVRPSFGQYGCTVQLSPSSATLNLPYGQSGWLYFSATATPSGGSPAPTNVVASLPTTFPNIPPPYASVYPSYATCGSYQSCGSSTVSFYVAPGLPVGVHNYTISIGAAFFGGPQNCGGGPFFPPTYMTTSVTVVVGGTAPPPPPPPPPPPTLVGMTPHRGVITGGDVATIAGSNLSSTISVTIGGWPATGLTIVSDSQIRFTLPQSYALGQQLVSVFTVGGTASLSGHFTYVPKVTGASPAVVAPGAPATIQLTGSGFGPTSVVNVDSVAVPTVYAAGPGGGTLTATVPQALVDDGFALTIEVEDALTAGRASPPFVVPVGNYANRGDVCVTPLRPAPGVLADIRVTGLAPQAPLALIFATAPTPFAPFPDATANFGLEVLSPTMIVVADGVGLGGPPVAPAAADAQGVFEAIVQMPAPVLGISGKLQALHLDAAAPSGFYLSWAYPLAF